MQSKRFATSTTRDSELEHRRRSSATRITDLDPILYIRPTEQGPRPELFITFDAEMMPRRTEVRPTMRLKLVRMSVVVFFFLVAAACGVVLA